MTRTVIIGEATSLAHTLDEGFAVVEQVAVGGVLEQDLSASGAGRGLDDARRGLSLGFGDMIVGEAVDTIEGHGLRRAPSARHAAVCASEA